MMVLRLLGKLIRLHVIPEQDVNLPTDWSVHIKWLWWSATYYRTSCYGWYTGDGKRVILRSALLEFVVNNEKGKKALESALRLSKKFAEANKAEAATS